MKNKVSFDFDSTLSRKKIQDYAAELIRRGFELWICTSRCDVENAPNKEWNDDLFEVADILGIKREHIIFTNYANKSEFLTDDFIFHLDDDWIELSFIKTDTKVTGISCFGNKNWKKDCNNSIKNNI